MRKLFILLISLVLLISAISYVNATCSGAPDGCSSYSGSESDCTSAGCNYNINNNRCTGQPNSCSTYTDQSTCQTFGCLWTSGAGETPTETGTASSGAATKPLHIFPEFPLNYETIKRGHYKFKVKLLYGGSEIESGRLVAKS